jgi:alkylhydroperoxidase/carboxymuconolactone decarboxylase family protein YurZ
MATPSDDRETDPRSREADRAEADAPGGPPDEDQDDWVFPFERDLHEVAPGLHEAQNAWLAQLDSLRAPDRKTHELIRMVCTVILRNPAGVRRHAMLAAEVGATWDEIAGSILLTEPSFGLLRGLEAMPHARRGYKDAAEHEAEDA